MASENIKYSVFDKKWSRLRSLVRHMKHIPFVDFVLVSGSMATGEATEESDFDLLIGARAGRIFIVRQFTAGLFGILGVRRKNTDGKSGSKDKICLNHFVTPAAYRLGEPHNEYWVHLYRHLIPVYGNRERMGEFFRANAPWSDCSCPTSDVGQEQGIFKEAIERLLGRRLGDWAEKLFKRYQMQRIERNLASSSGYKPIVKYDDTELRFHMDTRRIEEWVTERNRR